MSTYNGRRGPNVSQYLRDLNAINPQEPAEENYNMEEDLAAFTNTQFFDFETGQNTDYQAQPVKVDVETPPSATTSNDLTPAQSVMGDLTTLDFMQVDDYSFIVTHSWLVNEPRTTLVFLLVVSIRPRTWTPTLAFPLPPVCPGRLSLGQAVSDCKDSLEGGPLGSSGSPEAVPGRTRPKPKWLDYQVVAMVQSLVICWSLITTLTGTLAPTWCPSQLVQADFPSPLDPLLQGPSSHLVSILPLLLSPAPIVTPGHESWACTLANHQTMAGDFSFPDFTNAYPSTPLNGFPDGAQNFQTMQPNPSAVYPQVSHQPPQYGQPAPQSADKSKPSSGSGNRALNFEEASRHAAEEDKRRRNTAASARFRIKKKQREQALEKSAKEMSDKVSVLETKVQQLEMENKWLKNLLVEKNEGNDEIVSLWKEFAASKQGAEKSKSESKAATTVKDESR